MPTQIHNPRQSSRERYFARQSTYRLAGQTKFTEVLTAPWMGWVPDLPPSLVGWRGYRQGRGFVPFPYENRGMFLRHDDGYQRVDPTNLPLGRTDAGPPPIPTQLPGQFAVTMIGQYFEADTTPNRIAVVAGDPDPIVDVEVYMARMDPASGAWGELAHEVGITPGTVPTGNREALWDHCVFPFGAPTRTDATYGVHAPVWQGITSPCMVFCNANYTGPVDNVMITPVDKNVAGNPEDFYDELSDSNVAVAPGPNFKAASCETFDGRVHFLNTSENGTAYPQRHRWTAIGTADPDETIVGSGWLDIASFQRGGKRIESMQDKLVLYYGDGVAFQVPTGFYADAYRPQIVSRTRGLLGGQGLCAISPHLHFGIFNDGWWTLDSSGRWSKLGRLILEETRGKSHEMTKWEDSFYEDLDFDQTQRITCAYDRYRGIVRVAYPSKSTSSENYAILNYHLATDTCWQDEYSTPTTCWGILDLQQSAGAVWGVPPATGVPGTWDEQVITWDSTAAQYQEEVMVHGNGPTVLSVWDLALAPDDWENDGGVPPTYYYTTDGGLIFSRDPNLHTYDGVRSSLSYVTHEQNRNQNPLLGQTFHRLGVEYVRSDTATGLGLQITSDEGDDIQAQFVSLNEGKINTLHTAFAHFRLHANEHGFGIYGSSPLLIRSIVPELLLYRADDREGQV